MPDIHINRSHTLGMSAARKAAFKWAEQAENDFSMTCEYEEGKALDIVSFKRSGVDGTLNVTANSFELHAKLGFLVGAFKDRIQGEIEKNLDSILAAAGKGKQAAKKKAT